MSRNNYKVFSEGKIANLFLKNRHVRSATGDNKMTADGMTTDTVLKIYKDLAAGGVGMIITGVMAVMPANKTMAKQPCIYSEEYIAEISKIANIVHQTDNKCVIIAQLNHAGRQVPHDSELAECVGPSVVKSPILEKLARELSINEVQTLIDSFANSIVRVKKAGFDGVQLHAAHGYLLSSFLSPYTNKRTDKFGGSVRNRVRIIKDIVYLARKRVGSFPILIKINCDDFVEGGISKDTFAEFIKEIETTGVDAIEVSGGMWDCLVRSEEELGFFPIPESRTRINTIEKQSYFYDYIKNIDLSLPLILVGGHRNIERMESILKEGKVDYLSLCRPLISEPDLPNRWLLGFGKEIADCISCNVCLIYLLMGEFCCVLKREGGLKKEVIDNFVSQCRDKFK